MELKEIKDKLYELECKCKTLTIVVAILTFLVGFLIGIR